MLAKALNARSDGPVKQRAFSLDRPTSRASPDSTYAELQSYKVLGLYRKRTGEHSDASCSLTCTGALSIQRLEGSRQRLRRTQGLWVLNKVQGPGG
jgi:hypothetical protein